MLFFVYQKGCSNRNPTHGSGWIVSGPLYQERLQVPGASMHHLSRRIRTIHPLPWVEFATSCAFSLERIGIIHPLPWVGFAIF
jgi:hypothetical protein